jgi:hypothetical protein
MKLRARRIAPGRAEAQALVSRTPVSFVGGVDPVTGRILDDATGLRDQLLRGRAFGFPRGKGSTVGSYVLYGLAKRGAGPAAILMERADAIVAVGAILADIPTVDSVDLGAFVTGDRVLVDADAGRVELPGVRAIPVVTAFVRHRGRILLVRRGDRVGAFPGKWSGISGFLEGREAPAARARTEVREETGLTGLRLRATGRPLVARHGATAFVVHPFLFESARRAVTLDWENAEARWVSAAEIPHFDGVPRLADAFASASEPVGIRKR